MKKLAYGLGAAFVVVMLGLTVYCLVSTPIITQTCSTTNSSTWGFLTLMAAAVATGAIGFAASIDR